MTTTVRTRVRRRRANGLYETTVTWNGFEAVLFETPQPQEESADDKPKGTVLLGTCADAAVGMSFLVTTFSTFALSEFSCIGAAVSAGVLVYRRQKRGKRKT